jgi:hypothetical protein
MLRFKQEIVMDIICSCGGKTKPEKEERTFTYGYAASIELKVNVVVFTCQDCGKQYRVISQNDLTTATVSQYKPPVDRVYPQKRGAANGTH